MRARSFFLTAFVFAACFASARPAVTAESAIIVAASSGKVLYEKDADAKRYPASTTKIMTALLLCENVDPATIITAPDDVESVGGSSLHLRPGEKVSAGDLLLAILLRSANDAAYTVAIYMGGSIEGFAKMMNDRAKEIGCTSTHFVNPHGLHNPDHYTTARDLAKIARVAMQNERFARAAGSISTTITRSDNEEDVFIKTHNKFLETRPDATGVKTGWTVPAGRCFVGSAVRDGLSVITVVLKSDDWLDDSDLLADWAFGSWHRVTLVPKGTFLTSAWLGKSGAIQIKLAPKDDVETALTTGKAATYKVVSKNIHAGNSVKKGEDIGTVTIADVDGFETTVPVVALNGYDKPSASKSPIVTYGLVLAMIGGAWFIRRRVKQIT